MIRPVSGRKPLAGSSVVIRHCSAAPRSWMASWVRPSSAQGLAGGDPQLGADQVDVGDLLGHRVLDLDAGVHLDEDVAAVGGEQELDRAGVDVADLAGERDGVGAHPLAQLGVEVGGRGDLDDLLVPPLHRAVALEQVDDVAGRVGQDLHLDVAGADHRLLEEDRGVAERRLRLAHRGLERVTQVLLALDPAHAAPAAAGDGLDEDREADVGGGGQQRCRRRRSARSRAGWAARPACAAAIARALLPVRFRTSAGGPTNVMPAAVAGLGQVRVLREEAVAGVDRVGAGLDGDPDDLLRVEVGAHRVPRLADLVGLVRLEAVLALAVLVAGRPRPSVRRARWPRGRRERRSRHGWRRGPCGTRCASGRPGWDSRSGSPY